MIIAYRSVDKNVRLYLFSLEIKELNDGKA